jgi:coenzyme F420-reducing hydrogenase delta subunit
MPTNFRVIRVMCSSRVDPELILYTFKKGIDGVLVLGCHPGDCHYINGNYKTERRMIMLQKLLDQFGIDPKRLKLEWVSASEGAKFQEVITSFTKEIEELGKLELPMGKEEVS